MNEEMNCNWSHISLVEMLIVDPKKAEFYKGFRYYRVEYYTPDNDYSDYEAGIWLPATSNPRVVEKMINDDLKQLRADAEGQSMNKFVKDGKLALVVSGEHGAGWSTWAYEDERDKRLFDPELVKMLIAKNSAELEARSDIDNAISHYLEEQYGETRDTTWNMPRIHLHVVWVPVGKKFYVIEDDGKETVLTEEQMRLAKAD